MADREPLLLFIVYVFLPAMIAAYVATLMRSSRNIQIYTKMFQLVVFALH